MKLNRRQRKALIEWVAEGVDLTEINTRAAAFKPPFDVPRQNLHAYRKKAGIEIDQIEELETKNALISGYAIRETRVYKLSLLAALLEKDILNGRLWLEQKKGVGSGDIAEIFDYQEFNKGEVDAYRGVLDDIASEVGERIKNIDLKSAGKEIAGAVVNVYIPDNGRDKRD